MNNTNRDAFGAFTDTSVIGSPTWEQTAAGVTANDDAWAANRKVADYRSQQNRSYSHRSYEERDSSLPGQSARAYGFGILFYGIILFWVAVAYYAPLPTVYSSFSVRLEGFNAPKELRDSRRAEHALQMKPLFKENAPVKEFYKYCKARNCEGPDGAAILKMKKWAVNPAQYDTDICRGIRFGAHSLYFVEVAYKLSEDGQECIVSNRSEIKRNQLIAHGLFYLLCAIMLVLSLKALDNIGFWFQKPK